MIADHETNVVFVSDTLEREFPAVSSGLKDILGRHDIPLRTIPGTRSIWCRDYLPIQVSEDRFVQFRYAPDYLSGRYRHLRADGQIGPRLPHVKNCERSEIVMDGGNVVGGRDRAIICDKVFAENPSSAESDLIRKLSQLLEVEQVTVIPTEPGDVVGHSDGVVRFVDDGTVIVNDYGQSLRDYRRVLLRKVKAAGLMVREVPCRPMSGLSEGMPSAVGNYVNFLRVGPLIVIPLYGMPADERARASLVEAHPGVIVETLWCRELAGKGGALHCSTWSARIEAVPSDPPVSRIVPL